MTFSRGEKHNHSNNLTPTTISLTTKKPKPSTKWPKIVQYLSFVPTEIMFLEGMINDQSSFEALIFPISPNAPIK